MSAPRVSVVIPTYNRADLLPATLASVAAYCLLELLTLYDSSLRRGMLVSWDDCSADSNKSIYSSSMSLVSCPLIAREESCSSIFSPNATSAAV